MKKPSRAGGKPATAQSSKASKLKRNIVPKAAAHRSSATQQTTEWLETLGLGQYAGHFAEHEITVSILPDLTDADLKELGVSALGHRRILLRAIAELCAVGKDAPKLSVAPAAPIAPQPYDSAERRQVTVMFSDLVGSTALSARLDPEDLREIISAYQKCVVETVRRFGGFVAKYMGDGVLVYFGYPQAHEDDAERAVRAGLELIAEVNALKTGASLQTRVGIATGLVVVGDLIGSGEAQERGIIGETPNLAARLHGIAEPNVVVIAESTRKLLGNLFELEDLGPKDLKGIAGPVRAWAALRASSVESRFEALRTATTPLIGRDEEIDLLMRRWEQAKSGDGCVVLISGEPGIGKSRIAQTVVERISAEPHTRLRYFCSPHHQDSALYPIIAQLERAAGFRREDTPEQRLARLEAVLAQGTNGLSEAVPLLADLLSIPTGDRYPPLNLTPQKRKEKTLHAQLAQVEGLAARQPVLMVFEDVHWSDPTTRESLDLLIDRAPMLRALVILTFRPEFVAPWVGRPHVTLLSLSRLPPRQRAEMIRYVTGGKALPKEIANQIIDRTDGVPLFIEELTKAVVESGIVTEAGDHYTATGPVAPLAIPTSLHASLLARLDRLAPTREVVQIGAALGRSFSHELISAVAGMPQQQLNDALAQLVSAEMIFRRGTPPDAEYTFKHALVQDAAYGTLLRSRRQDLHAHCHGDRNSLRGDGTAAAGTAGASCHSGRFDRARGRAMGQSWPEIRLALRHGGGSFATAARAGVGAGSAGYAGTAAARVRVTKCAGRRPGRLDRDCRSRDGQRLRARSRPMRGTGRQRLSNPGAERSNQSSFWPGRICTRAKDSRGPPAPRAKPRRYRQRVGRQPLHGPKLASSWRVPRRSAELRARAAAL